MTRTNVELTVRHGVITASSLYRRDSSDSATRDLDLLVGRKLHELRSWGDALRHSSDMVDARDRASLVTWLHKVLPSVAK